jgi:hypothetical protein
MSDIIKLDMTDIEDTQLGIFQTDFELTSYEDDADIILAAARVEYIGDFPYRVEDGDLTVTDSGVVNGTVYILLKDDGDGTASAYVSTKAGDYDPNKGGYYVNDASPDDGAKVLFQMKKDTGPIYSYKARRWPSNPGGEIVSARHGLYNLDQRITIWSLIF